MAKIGSLTADLKLESAAFIRDLKKAADATAKNTSAMQRSMAGLNKTFASAGNSLKGFVAGFASVAAVRQLAQLGQQAIDTADDIGAAATKIGVSGEALQRFRFAAEQADVSTGELDAALKLFAKNLSSGTISAAGDSITEKFANYIQKVAEAPTQLEKVRIAQEAVGKQWQTLVALAANAAQVQANLRNAFVIPQEALDVASELDNSWKQLSNAISVGFDTGFLLSFSKDASLAREELENFNKAAEALGGLVGGTVVGIGKIASAFVGLRQTIIDARNEVRKEQAEGGGKGLLPELSFDDPIFKPSEDKPVIDDFVPPEIGEGVNKVKELADANRALHQAMSEGKSIFEQTRSPLEAYGNELERLSALLQQGAIDAETMARAQTMAAASAVQPWLNVAGTVGQALGTLFEDNKGVAIAQAIINTAQGVTAALAQYPPPLSFAMAAAQAALGAAQIATIKSTKPGGGGGRPSVSGGRGGAASGGGDGGKSGGGRSSQREVGVFLNLQGAGLLSQDQVRGIIEQLINAQKDGAKLVLSQP
jgi:hypothetical protein